MKKPFKWTEAVIARALVHQVFERAVAIVPNTTWTGHEVDLLVLHRPSLRVIDVEIKISRSDLKADMVKDKWWKRHHWKNDTEGDGNRVRLWPDKVWKHYYALPATIWDDKLVSSIPPASGVLLLHEKRGVVSCAVHRKAKPCPAAAPITPETCLDIARLCTLRYWEILKDQAC